MLIILNIYIHAYAQCTVQLKMNRWTQIWVQRTLVHAQSEMCEKFCNHRTTHIKWVIKTQIHAADIFTARAVTILPALRIVHRAWSLNFEFFRQFYCVWAVLCRCSFTCGYKFNVQGAKVFIEHKYGRKMLTKDGMHWFLIKQQAFRRFPYRKRER